jgi:mannosyltransferase
MHGRLYVSLGALTVIGALLRFSTLGAQGFWNDEAITGFIAHLELWELPTRISQNEGTPPLYYVAAWAWMKLFGSGEVGLRSLSAVCGTATIPAAYMAAAEFVSRRAALASAALVSVSPLLVWYSQEARSYALLVLLGALSLVFFARSLREPTARRLIAWAAFSALALATHYTAALLVLPEAAWLVYKARPGRPPLIAVAGVAVVVPPLAYLWLEQHANDATAEFIKEVPRGVRWVQIPEQFLMGFGPRSVTLLAGFVTLVILALAFLAWRGSPQERRGAAKAAALGAAVIAPLAVLSPLPSFDYLITRNVILAWLPLMIAVAAGLTARRAGRSGLLAIVALCSLSILTVVWIARTPSLQRPNWRHVAQVMGPATRQRVVVAPDRDFASPLPLHYLQQARPMPRSTHVDEIIIVELDRSFHRAAVNASSYSGLECWWGSICNARMVDPHPGPSSGFHLAERRTDGHFIVSRYGAARPRLITQRRLTRTMRGNYLMLVQTPG